MLAQAVAGTFNLNDHGMVQKSVQQGRCDDRIAENLAPFTETAIGGQDHRASLVAGVDQLEEQVACTGADGEIADLVDLCCARHKSTHVQSAVMWSCQI